MLQPELTVVSEAVMQVGPMSGLRAAVDTRLYCHSDRQYAHVLRKPFGPSPLSYTAMYAVYG